MELKNLAFRFKFKGIGIINFDHGNDDLHLKIFTKQNKENDNFKFAKKDFFFDEKGSLSYKVKISSECFKRNVLKDLLITSTIISQDINLSMDFIASEQGIIRGWSMTEKDSSGYKKNSFVTITDLKQTSNNKSSLDFHSNSGFKTNNSIFMRENIGETIYESLGFIDISELQFLSCDDGFDRLAFNSDNFNLFKKIFTLPNRFPEFDSEIKRYILKDSPSHLGERGILFSNSIQNKLLKAFLKRVFNVRIRRGGHGIGETIEMEIKEFYGDDERIFEESGWKKITSNSDIDNLNYTFKSFYEETDVNYDHLINNIRTKRIEDKKVKQEEAQKRKEVKMKRKEDAEKKKIENQ